ncbi:hypothetical protein V8B55DRAFT_1542840 [Mucor lusitanicus]|uniref:F-box domain-containing protein n=2 Tax=Mucor circinelloides f. lusitanicus TaxID=29924 RepID=A0A162QWS3_MUCCL|nr:hypothetical protein FB192DRAFT_1389143 [Mucor lusitanicus]OAD06330.1 hypothetical protein MUCCIDRAFT_106900 [Mucor lusitanicus CBS 277.49]
MADWEHLPYEVLQLILGFLPSSKHVYPCLFVCKSWHRPAIYCLFKHLYFGSEQQLLNYLQTISKQENRNYGLVTESIDIRRLIEYSSFIPITRLLGICANTKRIDHTGEAESYRLIKSLLARHKLQHLQYLPAPERYSTKEYIECAIQMRSQIKCLKLSEALTFTMATENFTILYSQLDQFTKLETLHLEKASNLEQIDEIIDSCTALKELDLKLHKPLSLRQLGFDVREESEQEENAIDYSKLKPHLTIQTAKLKIRSILPKHIEYVVHKFPKLLSLDLVPLTSPYELAPTCHPIAVSNGVLLNLLLALRKMRHVHVPFRFEVNDALDVVAKFLVVTNFDGTLEVSYQLVVNTKYRLDNPLISYSSEPLRRRLHLQYYKGLTQENQPLRGPTVMPHLTVVEVAGSYIKQLVIHGMSNKFVNGVVNAYYLVDYTLIRCPFLKHMGFIQCDLAYYPLEILPTPHIFLESLRFDDCLLHCPSFIKFSLVMPRLKRLVMKECQFSSYLTKRQSNGSTRRSITMSFPFTHFDLFRFKNIRQYRSLSKIYLKLTTDAETTYTMYSRDQTESTTVISKVFFHAPKVESDSLHIDLSCKSMKEFKMN